MENAPLIHMNNSDTKSGDDANTNRANNTAHSNTHASTIDGRKYLACNNASNDAPADLQDEVEDTSKLRRPVAHEISTNDLSRRPYESANDINDALF